MHYNQFIRRLFIPQGFATQRQVTHMPLVNVKVIEGVFTPSQKEEMVHKLTDAMVAVGGDNLRPVVSVIIEDVKSGDWGIGGQPITTEYVNQMLGATAPTG
jgi:4-oxalocrotonate tautomerase